MWLFYFVLMIFTPSIIIYNLIISYFKVRHKKRRYPKIYGLQKRLIKTRYWWNEKRHKKYFLETVYPFYSDNIPIRFHHNKGTYILFFNLKQCKKQNRNRRQSRRRKRKKSRFRTKNGIYHRYYNKHKEDDVKNNNNIPDQLIDNFCESFNPIELFRNIKELSETSIAGKYSRLNNKRGRLVKQAFIAAFNLQAESSRPITTTNSEKLRIYVSLRQNELPIVIDTGASVSLTPNEKDFIGKIRPCGIKQLNGLSDTTEVIGEGVVAWTVRDALGTTRVIQTKAYYVPATTIRLFSHKCISRRKWEGCSI